MKKLALSIPAVLATALLSGQAIQEISTGTGYQKQSYVQLGTGAQKQVNNTAWDIAFTVFGQQDAGIFINESSGSSMGQALPVVELYYALTDDFSSEPDPVLLEELYLLNSEKSWQYGAFNELRDTTNLFDYGWGMYNFQTNQVVGNAVFVVKLRNGQYRKIKIESLIGSTYTFRYANLDGSNEVVKTLDKADHAGKTLAYFSFDTGNTVDVEPASGGFDLLYCRYITPLLDPGSGGYIPYNVTGILHGPGVEVAKADGVDPASVSFGDYQDSLQTALDAIGYDWKTLVGTSWSLDDDRVYFVKTAENRVWKLHFIDFEGSATGTAVFEKTDLGIVSAVADPAALGLKALAYPNPVQHQLTLSLETPRSLGGAARFDLLDMQGKPVATFRETLREGFQVLEIPAAGWPAGVYTLRLTTGAQTLNLGKIVKL